MSESLLRDYAEGPSEWQGLALIESAWGLLDIVLLRRTIRSGEGADWVDGKNEQGDASGRVIARCAAGQRIVPVAQLTAEYDLAAETFSEWLAGDSGEQETLRILVRDQWQREQVVAALAERGVQTWGIDRGRVPTGLPVALTMHRTKARSSRGCSCLGCRSQCADRRRPTKPGPGGAGRALLRERALLYVASSRARDELGDQLQRCGEPVTAVSRSGRRVSVVRS